MLELTQNLAILIKFVNLIGTSGVPFKLIRHAFLPDERKVFIHLSTAKRDISVPFLHVAYDSGASVHRSHPHHEKVNRSVVETPGPAFFIAVLVLVAEEKMLSTEVNQAPKA